MKRRCLGQHIVNWLLLPNDVFAGIFSFQNQQDWAALARTSNRMAACAKRVDAFPRAVELRKPLEQRGLLGIFRAPTPHVTSLWLRGVSNDWFDHLAQTNLPALRVLGIDMTGSPLADDVWKFSARFARAIFERNRASSAGHRHEALQGPLESRR